MATRDPAEAVRDGVGNRENHILYESLELANRTTEYSAEHSTKLPVYTDRFHERISKERSDAVMLTTSFQSQVHHFLAKVHGAKNVLEVGTYVGYSAMVWSHAVGPAGKVTTLDVSEAFANIAREEFRRNSIQNVEIMVGDAAKTLQELHPQDPYDLVFIDADKGGYLRYLQLLLEKSTPGQSDRLLRPGALIMVDNVLRYGHVACPELETDYWPSKEFKEQELTALRGFNEALSSEPRLEKVILPLWDGVYLARLVD